MEEGRLATMTLAALPLRHGSLKATLAAPLASQVAGGARPCGVQEYGLRGIAQLRHMAKYFFGRDWIATQALSDRCRCARAQPCPLWMVTS